MLEASRCQSEVKYRTIVETSSQAIENSGREGIARPYSIDYSVQRLGNRTQSRPNSWNQVSDQLMAIGSVHIPTRKRDSSQPWESPKRFFGHLRISVFVIRSDSLV